MSARHGNPDVTYHTSAVQDVLGLVLVKLLLDVLPVLETSLALRTCEVRRGSAANTYEMDSLALLLQHIVQHAANPTGGTIEKPGHRRRGGGARGTANKHLCLRKTSAFRRRKRTWCLARIGLLGRVRPERARSAFRDGRRPDAQRARRMVPQHVALHSALLGMGGIALILCPVRYVAHVLR